jgi:hypothetical protein
MTPKYVSKFLFSMNLILLRDFIIAIILIIGKAMHIIDKEMYD